MSSIVIKKHSTLTKFGHCHWPTGSKNQVSVGGVICSVSRTLAEKTPLTTITINSLIVGSSVGVYDNSDTLITAITVSSTSAVLNIQYIGNIRIEVRKGNGVPTYKLWETRVTIYGSPLSIIALQELD